jgi:hypothetical protein
MRPPIPSESTFSDKIYEVIVEPSLEVFQWALDV